MVDSVEKLSESLWNGKKVQVQILKNAKSPNLYQGFDWFNFFLGYDFGD